ncbi:MAG: hypothetical protein JNL58_04040 [Planctomyces sp.]|nr:hypothetical protein [Planctomyces sp.]
MPISPSTQSRQQFSATGRSLGDSVKSLSLRIAVVLGTLISISLTSSSAFADTCGDYLYRNGHPVSAHGHMNHHSEVPADPNAPEPTGFSQKKLPCNSPSCRGQSTPLAPVPVHVEFSRYSDPASLLDELMLVATGRGPTCVPVSERGELLVATDIFRPPRG